MRAAILITSLISVSHAFVLNTTTTIITPAPVAILQKPQRESATQLVSRDIKKVTNSNTTRTYKDAVLATITNPHNQKRALEVSGLIATFVAAKLIPVAGKAVAIKAWKSYKEWRRKAPNVVIVDRGWNITIHWTPRKLGRFTKMKSSVHLRMGREKMQLHRELLERVDELIHRTETNFNRIIAAENYLTPDTVASRKDSLCFVKSVDNLSKNVDKFASGPVRLKMELRIPFDAPRDADHVKDFAEAMMKEKDIFSTHLAYLNRVYTEHDKSNFDVIMRSLKADVEDPNNVQYIDKDRRDAENYNNQQ